MKNIQKIIYLKTIEVIVVIVALVLSSYIWSTVSKSELFQLIQEPLPNSYAYVEVLEENVALYPMNDEMALSILMPNTVKMINDTYLDTKYALGIRVFKTSTLDYKNLKISFHGKVEYLKDYYLKEDEEYYYFLLDKGNIQADTVLYNVKLWLDIEASSNTKGKVFEYEFINLESEEI